jgi:hypothetical protein
VQFVSAGKRRGGALALALYYLFAASLAVSRRAGQRRSAACRAQKMAGTCRAGRGRVTGVHVTRRDQRGSGPVAFRLSHSHWGRGGARRIRGHGSFLPPVSETALNGGVEREVAPRPRVGVKGAATSERRPALWSGQDRWLAPRCDPPPPHMLRREVGMGVDWSWSRRVYVREE